MLQFKIQPKSITFSVRKFPTLLSFPKVLNSSLQLFPPPPVQRKPWMVTSQRNTQIYTLQNRKEKKGNPEETYQIAEQGSWRRRWRSVTMTEKRIKTDRGKYLGERRRAAYTTTSEEQGCWGSRMFRGAKRDKLAFGWALDPFGQQPSQCGEPLIKL